MLQGIFPSIWAEDNVSVSHNVKVEFKNQKNLV